MANEVWRETFTRIFLIMNVIKGAFVWNQSGIRIIGIMGVSVSLGAILISEYLDFHSGYSAPRSSKEQNSRNTFRNIFLFRNIPNERALKLAQTASQWRRQQLDSQSSPWNCRCCSFIHISHHHLDGFSSLLCSHFISYFFRCRRHFSSKVHTWDYSSRASVFLLRPWIFLTSSLSLQSFQSWIT